jgi:pimeloyl-ACP methyl ester carboxylesterase
VSTPRQVASPDGVQVAVYEQGAPDGPTVVAVHGYPDNHAVWDGLAGLLADRCHVVTYDVRGAGNSDHPPTRASYRMGNLLGDLAAVLDAVSPDEPVHLVGHDWGSIQCWAALTDDRLAARIASFTSISGPGLDYGAAWLRDARSHPRDVLRQLPHSFYLPLFLLPWLPERAIRSGVLQRLSGHRASESDQLTGLQLYRANLRGGAARPTRVPSSVRVQVVLPDRDPYVTGAFAAGAPQPWVDDLTVHRIAGGHWVVSSRPDLVADLVASFVGC